MTSKPHTPLLDTVPNPDELRKLKPEQLRQLSDELRAETISALRAWGQEGRVDRVAVVPVSSVLIADE